MDGVDGLVVFVLASLAFPALIKKQTRFYLALGIVVAIIAADAFGHMSVNPYFVSLIYVLVAFLQAVELIALVQAAGGRRPRK